MVDATTAAGALWRSSAAVWIFPQAFFKVPALMQGRHNNTTLYWTVAGVSTTTTGEGCAFSYQSTSNRALNLVAVGSRF